MSKVLCIVAALLLLATMRVSAHHAFAAEYDENKLVEEGDGYRAKNGSNVANARTVTLPDGRKLFGGFQSTPGAPVK